MQQVAQLREETASLTCDCSSPDCPFKSQEEHTQQQQQQDDSCSSSLAEKESPDLGFGSMEFLPWATTTTKSLPAPLPLHPAPASVAYRRGNLKRNTLSTSLTNIPRGVQKRADGTIIEQDYPGFYSPDSKRSYRGNRLTNGFSMSHLNRLEVCFNEELEADCQVDQDGLTSNHNYMFSRKAPERRNIVIRREQSNSSTSSQRRRSEIPMPTFKQSLVDMVSCRHSSIGSDTVKPTLMKRHSMVSA